MDDFNNQDEQSMDFSRRKPSSQGDSSRRLDATGGFSRRNSNTSEERSGHTSYFKHGGQRQKPRKSAGNPKHNVALLALGVVILALVVFGTVKIVGALTETDEKATFEPGIAVTVEIPEGSSTSAIASLLEENGIVDDSAAFTSYVSEQGAESSLKPGTYAMETGMEYGDVLSLLISGPNAAGAGLTIPEGYTIEQTAAKVEEVCGIPAADFTALCYSASTYAVDYPFLSDVYNNSLEGYLFPKTYQIPEDATADSIVRMMLSQFQTETAGLDISYAASQGLDLNDVVTMASLIEEEAFFDEDRAHIASVLYNRLNTDMYLGLDVTVSYALGVSGADLTSDDLAIDSPYNTYVVKGLPAGPISSPSLKSIQAAVAPETTEDYYFILTSEYSHFYTTYEAFLEGKAAYKAEG